MKISQNEVKCEQLVQLQYFSYSYFNGIFYFDNSHSITSINPQLLVSRLWYIVYPIRICN